MFPDRRLGFIGFGPGGLPPVVKNLLLVNAAVYFLDYLFFRSTNAYGISMLAQTLGLTPILFWHGHIYQVVTYMFLHGGFMHILFNMFALWMFGSPLEMTWGSKRFLKFYFICGIGAGVLNVIITPMSQIPIVGASGAIYGLLLAFGMLYPNQVIYLYMLFPIKAKYFVMIIGGIELFVGLTNSHSGVAHFAHLGGMLFGLLYIKKDRWFRSFREGREEKRRRKNLRVVWNRDQEMEKLQREVDELLDKINQRGIGSLSQSEITRLREASRKLKEWEQQA